MQCAHSLDTAATGLSIAVGAPRIGYKVVAHTSHAPQVLQTTRRDDLFVSSTAYTAAGLLTLVILMRGAMRQLRAALLLALLTCYVFAAPSSSSPAPDGGSGDSLRGALEALDRRQRALQHRVRPLGPGGPAGRYRYPALRQMHEDDNDEVDDEDIEFLPLESGQPEDIGYGFQRGGPRHETHVTPAQLERMLLEYLDEGTESGADERWTSPFREREEQQASDDEAPTSIFRERQRQEKRTAAPADDRYLQLLTALWDKYQRELEQQQATDEESLEKRQDGYDGYDFYNSPMGWGDGHFNGFKRNAEDDPWYPAYELVPRHHSANAKRFSIKKRSSGPAVSPVHKKVGAKVDADLANIFEKKANSSNSSVTTEAPPTVTAATGSPPHPAMHKKSVDWSQYFGIDRRRKKSSPPSEPESSPGAAEDANQEETERRLMEQYYRTLALATTVKRKRSGGEQSEQQEQQPSSLEGMDQKLKAMEDLIVDEAVKFTGAHQGSVDPKELQTVKEQVLSRLAAAYSLEKMRQALDEFRASLDQTDDEPNLPEKRRTFDCKELNTLSARCSRVQPAIVESCTWHHACQQCTGGGSVEMCNAGFLKMAEQECERRATAEMYSRYASNVQVMCMRGARRLLAFVEHAGSGIKVPCQPCVRRFLEARRRR